LGGEAHDALDTGARHANSPGAQRLSGLSTPGGMRMAAL